ncbi:MAG: permease-like cell division protein FtsX [Gammaproteobacteria bacterium]|nr:permease-like cell division protein FtsX [Gammaproteobacteria bacterium]
MKNKSSKSNLNNHAFLWLEHHIDSFRLSFTRVINSPVSFIFTVLMIAIALSIPMSLYVVFSSAQQLTDQWDNDKQITLFLKDKLSYSEAQKLADSIADKDMIAEAYAINKNTALDEFKLQMSLESITENLPENPLPHLIIANPESSLSDLQALQSLEVELSNLKQVQEVQFDLIWFQRLQAILGAINRIQWIVSFVLLLAIALIIANVIRWEVTSRHAEIEIIKLVGASDTYVRRPFLYSGFWLGLIGSIVALIMVSICGLFIQQSTIKLSSLFGSDFQLTSLSMGLAGLIMLSASLLGVGAAWVAVTHKLKSYS